MVGFQDAIPSRFQAVHQTAALKRDNPEFSTFPTKKQSEED